MRFVASTARTQKMTRNYSSTVPKLRREIAHAKCVSAREFSNTRAYLVCNVAGTFGTKRACRQSVPKLFRSRIYEVFSRTGAVKFARAVTKVPTRRDLRSDLARSSFMSADIHPRLVRDLRLVRRRVRVLAQNFTRKTSPRTIVISARQLRHRETFADVQR